jgi:hypothetical protein
MISVLAGGDPDCSDGNCPTVYVDDQAPDTVIIQGDRLNETTTAAIGEIPTHEGLLQVPRELIISAYKQLMKDQA